MTHVVTSLNGSPTPMFAEDISILFRTIVIIGPLFAASLGYGKLVNFLTHVHERQK